MQSGNRKGGVVVISPSLSKPTKGLAVDLADVKRLVADSGESTTIELKKSTGSLKSVAQTLCAFLNSQGGTVFIGISDNHKIVGVEYIGYPSRSMKYPKLVSITP